MTERQTQYSQEFTITLIGDIMLGRLIDQLLPTHVDEAEEKEIVSHFRDRHVHLQVYNHLSPWGNALSLFKKSDLVLGNLETSATTHSIKWPDKVFNYRMHPDNVKCLTEAGVDYVSLANNHTLDFSVEGLKETVRALKTASVAFAGAGENPREASEPAKLVLRPRLDEDGAARSEHAIHVYSFSDHPSDWKSVQEFNHLNYSSGFKETLRASLKDGVEKPALKVVSIHWGPNYRWQPDQQIRDMAYFLIDACAVDVVWGHSSHHVQGVETYRGKLIIYGCGDFVDDYAVNREYRNDLSAAWNLIVGTSGTDGDSLRVKRLEVWPNRIKHFQAGILDSKDDDHVWVTAKFRKLCQELGTAVNEDLGEGGQIVVNLAKR